MIRNLVLSYDVYEDLLGKCNKGVDFYKRIQANVSTLLERTQRVCRMQHEERQQIRDRYRGKSNDLLLNTQAIVDLTAAVSFPEEMKSAHTEII